MMDDGGSQGIKKVHFRDSSSQHPIVTYKRRRQQKPQTQQQLAQSPPPQQQQPEPQLQPLPVQQMEPQPQVEPEPKAGDVPAQQLMLRARDIGWEHAVDLDGNKRRWQCKFCSLCRSGGVTTLKAHLIDDSCPNVPKEISKKVSNFIVEKRATRLLLNNYVFNIDEDFNTQVQGGTVEYANEQQPLRNATYVRTLDKAAINEIAAGSKQCGAESSGQPVERSDQPEEQCTMDYDKMDQVPSNKNQILDKNTENSKNTKILKHIIIVDQSARHWRCRYCGMDGYGKKFWLHYHLAGAFRQPKCPNVPREVFAKARRHVLTKRRLKRNKAEQQIPSSPQTVHLSGEEQKNNDPLCGNQSQLSINNEHREPMMEEGPHGNGLCGDTNKLEEQRSDFGISDCWRYVLDGLMHLPDVQEDAGIGTCIRDALLYGCAEFGTVAGKVEMDRDKTVNANTAKCQNILMDVLRSENFALLCSVLCRTVHQDGERTRYFDFSVIDSRMKNGNYGNEPELFVHDLKLLWKDLKVAGQDIIHLANNLSSLTQDSYEKLVGRERGSDDGELNGAVVAWSEPRNLVQSNALVPFTSQGLNQLDQPGPSDLSDVYKDSICIQCGKEARSGSVLKCCRCMLPCHISCIEATDSSISTGRWCCKNCSAGSKEPVEGHMVLAHYYPDCLHENCVVCDRLAACRSPKCEVAPNDDSREMVTSRVDSLADPELPEIDTCYSCKICGDIEEDEKRFLICGHVHCLYKYYHIRCLKSKQISSNVQRGQPCWYCPSCLCRVCLSDKDDDLTILCDGCDEAYHLYCITPRRTSIPKGHWYCSSCSVERANEGMRQYERTLKLHRKDDAGLPSWNYDGVDLLLSAAEQLRADEQLVTTN